jgi:uncharacterized membrane protein (UPF0127 family)
MRLIRLLITASAALSLAACSLPGNAGKQAATGSACEAGANLALSEAGLEQTTLCVTSKGKTHRFTAELAKTPAQQARGMMFRTTMADDTGMLFPYSSPKLLSFWMKNTYIPLDIIFIREDGTIENIAANAEPYSLESVTSTGPAIAVLEIRGGLSAELGIEPDDKVSWKQ